MPIYKANIHTTLGSLEHENCIYVDEPTGNFFADAVAEQVGLRWQLSVMPILSDQLGLDRVVVSDINNTTEGLWSPAAAVNGGIAEGPLPPNCAYRVQKSIAASNRRGQIWLPAPPSGSFTVEGRVTQTRQTEVTIAMEAFRNNLGTPAAGGPALNLNIQSKRLGAVTYPEVTRFDCANVVGSQRRRRF